MPVESGLTIYMLHYNPQHVSRSTLLTFRRTNCIITASRIVTLCKRTAVQYAGWERTNNIYVTACCTVTLCKRTAVQYAGWERTADLFFFKLYRLSLDYYAKKKSPFFFNVICTVYCNIIVSHKPTKYTFVGTSILILVISTCFEPVGLSSGRWH